MFNFIGDVLAFFYEVFPSYGVAIVLLTLTVMVVATPLTLKSTKSMLQMQRLQPELKAIQNRYKDDRQKMNEELMAFYQENGINPLGGCLPMLIQLPIFLVLFRVVRGITQRATGIGTQWGWTAGQVGAGLTPTTEAASFERTFDPQNVSPDSALFKNLHGQTEMVSWGFDLARTPQQALSENLVEGLPYLVMIAIVLASSLYQQKQIRGRNTGAQVNPQQEMLMKVMPFMLPVFSLTMPAALVVYFVVSNLYRIGQQAYITQSLYKGEDSVGAQVARQRAEANRAEGKSTKGAKDAAANGRAGGSRGRSTGGRTTEKKGRPTPKRDGQSAGRGGRPAKQKSKKSSSGAGRTGKAPSRQSRGSGRTTPPGSSGNKKRKK